MSFGGKDSHIVGKHNDPAVKKVTKDDEKLTMKSGTKETSLHNVSLKRYLSDPEAARPKEEYDEEYFHAIAKGEGEGMRAFHEDNMLSRIRNQEGTTETEEHHISLKRHLSDPEAALPKEEYDEDYFNAIAKGEGEGMRAYHEDNIFKHKTTTKAEKKPEKIESPFAAFD